MENENLHVCMPCFLLRRAAVEAAESVFSTTAVEPQTSENIHWGGRAAESRLKIVHNAKTPNVANCRRTILTLQILPGADVAKCRQTFQWFWEA